MNAHSSRTGILSYGLALVTALLGSAGCTGDDGDTGPQGPPGDAGTDSELSQGEAPPGLTVAVQSLTGGTGSGGSFRVGDRPRVNFRLQKGDGSDWDIAELSSGRAIVSGPTFNYQRVIAEVTDLLTASVAQTDGSYTYTFATAIPASYLAPINDTPAFGPEDGELTGQALLEGTYTVGLTLGWDFTVDGESERDSGNATASFVIGAGAAEPREVVRIENCNRCHEQLRVHGGRREEATLCVLCHTAGAESDDPPGTSIDFKVMIHKIHAGEHLPSVLGVATNPDGSRNYAATPTPYVVGGNDYSSVAFPAWPQGLVALPRDEGYSTLSSTDKATEDTIRKGPSNCIVCHGDPDGDGGPLTAPAQGDLYKTQPTRQACGSCHDDVEWGQSYTANGQTMGAQANNANCKLCHGTAGNPLAVFDAHLHPLQDPSFDPGLNFEAEDLVEAGTNDGDGTFDPGEKLRFTLRILDDAGAEVAPADISAPSVVISGPTGNYNLILNTTLPTAALTGAQPFTVNVPMTVRLERLGVTAAGLQTFSTAFDPHLNVSGALTSVLERTATGGGDAFLSAASAAPQNFVDVNDATGFARDDYVVVDDGTADEEYVRIQFVEGNRLWFSSPYTTGYKAGLERAHLIGDTVREVTLVTKTSGVDFSVNASAGSITELVDFVDGHTVLADYTTDFVLPATYPLALNDSPDLGEESGEWAGKPLADGTYTLGIWSSRTLTLDLFGETNSYRSTSDAPNIDFLVGSADTVEPYALIESTSCFNCHQELAFHGFGRRGFESCVLCHGTAGAEDRPQYVAGNAPETEGTSVSFRTMLHKIHMGEELANASTYDVIGHGSAAYPNNFGVTNFGEVVFPALPGGVQQCNKCHGNDAWHEPAPRAHPTDQGEPILRWTAVCASCHDTSDAQAHIRVQTDSLGNESCGVCHSPGKDENVEKVHKPY
jgi:OmcA/MtrC family decaheme c-type cytochrome